MRTLYSKVVGTDGETVINYVEMAGLSTDTKPTDNIAAGSVFLEVDTGLVAIFNEEDNEWTGGTVAESDEGGV